MTDVGGAGRTCHRCGEAVPEHRTVCPACGTLQRPRPIAERPSPPAPPPGGSVSGAALSPSAATGADPWRPTRPTRAARARASAPPPATPATPATPAPSTPAPSTPPPGAERPDEPWPEELAGGRRRTWWRPAAAVVAGLALVVGAVAVVGALDEDDGTGAPAAATIAPGTGRAAAVRTFCTDPEPLTGPGTIATFTPGEGTVAYAQLPPPASSTDPPAERVLQVSPVVGEPSLTLEGSIDLVSLAVCVHPERTRSTKGSCTYEVTTPGALGDRVRTKLLATTYRAEIVELRTAETLAEGTLDTATDRCPEFATLDGSGVSNPLTDGDLAVWIGLQMPGGVPAAD